MYLRMMKVLLVCATRPEIQGITDRFNLTEGLNVLGSTELHLIYTGVGMVATAWAIGRYTATHSFDIAINAGIAGSFNRDIPLGTVLQVSEDHFAELGAEDGALFMPISAMGFGEETERPLAHALLRDMVKHIPAASALTVNTVHGHEPSILSLKSRLNVDLESMEGAAFYYACRMCNLPSIQLRAVSNYVERRNRAAWDIKSAIHNLNAELAELINLITR